MNSVDIAAFIANDDAEYPGGRGGHRSDCRHGGHAARGRAQQAQPSRSRLSGIAKSQQSVKTSCGKVVCELKAAELDFPGDRFT
jgi:hypothetical protein